MADSPLVPLNMLGGVTWRYDQSPNLLSILNSKQAWYSSQYTQFWEGWINQIFSLKEANTFGVAVWAFILNVPISVIGLQEEYRYWAFGPTRANFRDSSGEFEDNPTSGNFPPISDSGSIATPEEKIWLLRLRYYGLTSNCTITEINRALADVFAGKGLVYVSDNQDMTMDYVFSFVISLSFRESMLEYALPKPSGVRINIISP